MQINPASPWVCPLQRNANHVLPETWNTTGLQVGDYRLRLVVNLSSQFVPPYELQVFVER
jgi:hypothetical protein